MKQEQSNSTHEQKLLIQLSINDLTAIGHALFPYAQFVHRIIPPSEERRCILIIIEQLRRKIASFQSSNSASREEQFSITEGEWRIIDAALSTFLDGVQRLIPQSTERDEIIQACHKLRQYLVTAFSSRESE
jgi:hypothetical protein